MSICASIVPVVKDIILSSDSLHGVGFTGTDLGFEVTGIATTIWINGDSVEGRAPPVSSKSGV